MNKHLRIGISSGLTFGCAMAAFGYVSTGSLIQVAVNLVGGLIFGSVVALFSSRGERRLNAQGIEVDDLCPAQLRKAFYPGPTEDAMQVVRLALRSLRKVDKLSEASNPLQLKAKTGVTFHSLRENVCVKFTPTQDGTDIEISSKPRLFTAMMDMGKGVENVETIVKVLIGRGATRRAA